MAEMMTKPHMLSTTKHVKQAADSIMKLYVQLTQHPSAQEIYLVGI